MKKHIILPLLAIAIMSCEPLLFETAPTNDPEAVFEDLWTTFNTDYAIFDERNVDWDLQYASFRPQVNSSTTEDELYAIFTEMLSPLNDGHVSLVTPNRKVFNSNTYFNQEKEDSLFNLDLIKKDYLNNDYLENGYGGNTYGMIGNIGYLHLAWIGDNFLDMDEVLDHFETADGLIVDMRNNGGGDFTYAYLKFGQFTNQERHVHRSKTKNGPEANDYTKWYDWNIYPKGEYFDKPIVLLTDRYTISAGERTVMAFKTLPNLLHMGDSTNGALSTKIGKELANGWYYSVSPQKIEFVDGKSYEGIGLVPDVYSKNTFDQIQLGKDEVLELAIAEFK